MTVGLDTIEISRIKRSMKNPRFLSRLFTPSELKYFSTKGFNPAVVAGSFVAKEAFSKAMGTGFRGFSFNEISVLRDYMGTPYISVIGRAKFILSAKKVKLLISIAATKTLVTSVVISHPITL